MKTLTYLICLFCLFLVVVPTTQAQESNDTLKWLYIDRSDNGPVIETTKSAISEDSEVKLYEIFLAFSEKSNNSTKIEKTEKTKIKNWKAGVIDNNLLIFSEGTIVMNKKGTVIFIKGDSFITKLFKNEEVITLKIKKSVDEKVKIIFTKK